MLGGAHPRLLPASPLSLSSPCFSPTIPVIPSPHTVHSRSLTVIPCRNSYRDKRKNESKVPVTILPVPATAPVIDAALQSGPAGLPPPPRTGANRIPAPTHNFSLVRLRCGGGTGGVWRDGSV